VEKLEISNLTVNEDLPEEAVTLPERKRTWTLAQGFQYVTNSNDLIQGPIAEREHREEQVTNSRRQVDLKKKNEKEEEMAKQMAEELKKKEEEGKAPISEQDQSQKSEEA
jgi:hypothetical protein